MNTEMFFTFTDILVPVNRVNRAHRYFVRCPSLVTFACDQVIVLLMRDSEIERAEDTIRAEKQQMGGGLDGALIVTFMLSSVGNEEVLGREVPRKTLLNAVGDLCQTR